jgi:hypothetical protein
MGKKDNIIRRVEGIDEKQLLESMVDFGKQEMKPASTPAEKEIEVVKEEEAEESKVNEPIKAKVTDNYKSVFLQKRELKTRQCVYISLDVHETIVKIVNQIADNNVSVGVYVDTVMRQHFEINKQEINALYRKKKDDLIK